MDYSWPCVVLSTVLLTVKLVSASVDVQPSPVATVTEGAELWLTCTYDLTGGTLGQLQWKDKDGGNVATATPTSTPPCPTPSENYNIDCNLASNEVRLGILNPVHGDTYSCTVYLSDFTLLGSVSTQVAVIVPVTSVTVTSPVSQTVTVTPGGSQLYTCVTGSCRPPARIDWYTDGVNVTPQTGSVSSIGDKFVTNSSLTLTGSKGDTPATVQCRASNMDGMSPLVSGDKTFVVEWAPDGPPVISGYTSVTILYVNNTLSLRCRQPGGNPLATLTWSGACGGIPATNNNNATEAVSDISITVTKGYNQATCTCMSTHPQPQSQDRTQVTFTVHYAPDKDPVITGYTDGQIIYEGTPDLSLTCTQAGGNPLATITWDCVGQTGTPVGGSTTQTASTVQVPRDRDINRESCSCTARSPDINVTFVRTASVIFTIYYAPLATQLPRITGYTSGEVLYEGDNAKPVECHQAGGFPLATLTWNCFGLGSTDTATDSVSISRIQLSKDRPYNGRNCTCTAAHPDSKVIYRRSVYVTITIYYPPSTPVLTRTPTHPWLEGDSGTLMCNYSEGFPGPARIQWFRDGNLQTGQSSSTLTLTTLSHTDDRAGYSCHVSNNFTETKFTDLESSTTNLNVEYKPMVTLTTTQLTVVEGESGQATCGATGNPTPTLQWLRAGSTVRTGNGTSLDLTFENVVRSATGNYTCQAEGVSTVLGRQLVTEEITVILVQYPPDVLVVVPSNVTEGDTGVRLMCKTTGEPNILISQSWTQTIGQSFITDQFAYETAAQDTIILSEVSLNDTGTYTCSVSNGIADRQGQTLQITSTVLNVKVAPTFNIIGQTHQFYSQLHELLSIKIAFYSNPSVTSTADLEWKQLFTGAQIITSEDITLNLQNEAIELHIKGRAVKLSGQAAVMTIQSFEEAWAGDYTLTLYNDERRRQATANFSIISYGHPEKPTYFRLIDYTSTSITVEWMKDFNGGHPQTFVIIYGSVGGNHIQAVSVSEQQQSTYTKEITNLKPNTRYQLNMYASNDVGNSSLSSAIDIIGKTQHRHIECTAESQAISTDTGVIAVSIGGGMILLSLVILASALFTLRTGHVPCGWIKQEYGRKLSSENDRQGEQRYEDLSLEQVEVPSVYDEVAGTSQDNLGSMIGESSNTYEQLQRRVEGNEYEDLTPKSGTGEDRTYVNTSLH